MSKYFDYFPKILYDVKKDGLPKQAINILKRFIISPSVFENGAVFYEYEIQDGDRPDIIAGKYYGDSNLAWVVIYFNRILNPLYDFPLSNDALNEWIKDKYGSIQIAQAQIHHYEKIIYSEYYSADGKYIPSKTITIDETTYNNTLPSERKIVYCYEYELEKNNNKRFIRLLDKRYIPQLLDEVEKVFE